MPISKNKITEYLPVSQNTVALVILKKTSAPAIYPAANNASLLRFLFPITKKINKIKVIGNIIADNGRWRYTINPTPRCKTTH